MHNFTYRVTYLQIFVIFIITGQVVTSQNADIIQFVNGDIIKGRLIEINQDKEIQLKSKISNKVISIDPNYLKELMLVSEEEPEKSLSKNVFLLRGKEHILGNILEINEDEISIETPYEKNLNISRVDINFITAHEEEKSNILSPLGKREDWKGSKVWNIKGEELNIRGSGEVSRKAAFPNNFLFEFLVDWREELRLRVYICSNNLNTRDFSPRYILDINSKGVNLKRQTGKKGQKLVEVSGLHPFTEEELEERQVDIKVGVDRSNGYVTICLNNTILGRYYDESNMRLDGEGLIFESNSPSESLIKVKNVSLSSWNTVTSLPFNKIPYDRAVDVLLDYQGLAIQGTLKKHKKDGEDMHIVFQNKETEESLEIPLSKMTALYMGQAEDNPKIREGKSLSVNLKDSSIIILSDVRFSEGVLTGEHGVMGSLTIPRGYISSIEYNMEGGNGL